MLSMFKIEDHGEDFLYVAEGDDAAVAQHRAYLNEVDAYAEAAEAFVAVRFEPDRKLRIDPDDSGTSQEKTAAEWVEFFGPNSGLVATTAI